MQNKLVKSKVRNNDIFKYWIAFVSSLLGVIFITLVVFITINAVQGFKDYGFSNIIFTNEFNNTDKSFWLPFSVTMLSSLIALLVALFLGVKSATFIKYRMSERLAKWARIIFETLSGIPSVMFGLFAVNSFGLIFDAIGISSRSVFNASIMLSFMVLPTIISMTLNALNGIDENLFTNPIALGNTKTRSIYKVSIKAIKSNILVIAIIAFSRAIGESMAMSMILQSSPSTDQFSEDGFFGIFASSSQSLGAFISTNMFSDANPEKVRPLLYSFGFIMLIIVMALNIFITVFSKKTHKTRHNTIANAVNRFSYWFWYVPRSIAHGIEYVCSKGYRAVCSKEDSDSKVEYAKSRRRHYFLSDAFTWYKVGLEILSIVICSLFLCWIFGDILLNGLFAVNASSASTFVYTKNSVGQSFLITLLVILVTMVIAFPISFFISIYLSEYVKNEKVKTTITFFIDSISATPSIIFGMFGVLLFIDTLGMSANGKQGNSLIAGILTLTIVILPTFIRTLQQAFEGVSENLRINSYALGNTKFETIRKIVIPTAFKGITTSFVLTIGRILSETAPLYLTAGLSSSWVVALNRPGTTLTIQIYAQQFSPTTDRVNIQYEAAFLTLILVLSTVLLGYWLIPNWKNIKENIRYTWAIACEKIKALKRNKGIIIYG